MGTVSDIDDARQARTAKALAALNVNIVAFGLCIPHAAPRTTVIDFQVNDDPLLDFSQFKGSPPRPDAVTITIPPRTPR